MKRIPVAATAVLAGTIPFLTEPESPACKETVDITCVAEQIARIPEPVHAAEEPPSWQAPDGMVAIMFSPVIYVEKGSPEHYELQAELDRINSRQPTA